MRRETWEGTTIGSSHPRPLQDEATRAWKPAYCAVLQGRRHAPENVPAQHRPAHLLRQCQLLPHTRRRRAAHRRRPGLQRARRRRCRPRRHREDLQDRPPAHLTETDARKLLSDALAEYRRTHGHQPARIVLHKTSRSALRRKFVWAITRLCIPGGSHPAEIVAGITQSREAALPRCLAHGPEAGRSGREAGKGCHCRRGSRVRGPGIRARHPVGHAARELRSGGSRRGPREGG